MMLGAGVAKPDGPEPGNKRTIADECIGSVPISQDFLFGVVEMRYVSLAVVGFVGLLAVGGIRFSSGQTTAQDKSKAVAVLREPDSRYSVAPGGDLPVLVDCATGRTWLLQHSVDSTEIPVWIPITRLEDDQAAALWRVRVKLEDARKTISDPNDPIIRQLEEQVEQLRK